MKRKIEEGVMIVKDGKGWGCVRSDGHTSSLGWVLMVDAGIHNPKYLKKPMDAIHEGSHSPQVVKEVRQSKLVSVRKITTVEILDEHKDGNGKV